MELFDPNYRQELWTPPDRLSIPPCKICNKPVEWMQFQADVPDDLMARHALISLILVCHGQTERRNLGTYTPGDEMESTYRMALELLSREPPFWKRWNAEGGGVL